MHSQPLWRLLLSVALMVSLGSAVSAQLLPDVDIQYYVSPDAPTPYEPGVGGGDGLSWDEAFTDLIEFLLEFPALVGGADPGTVFRVNVAGGTYQGWAPNPFVEDASFMIPNNLYIYGGYRGSGPDADDRDLDEWPTVLSGIRIFSTGAYPECGATGTSACDQSSSVPGCDDAECCALVCAFRGGLFAACCDVAWDVECTIIASFVCGHESEKLARAASVVRTEGAGRFRRLDGVTISGGGERPAPPAGIEPSGGGVLVTAQDIPGDVRLVIVRSRIEDNLGWNGGGVAATGDGEVDCDGLGSNAEVVIWNSEIVDNRAVLWGGGVFARYQAPYEIVNTVIARNGHIPPGLGDPVSPLSVGGALADFTSAIPNVARRIVNCTIVRNFGFDPGIAVNVGAQQNCGCAGTLEEQVRCSTWAELEVINTVIRNNLQNDGQGNFVECLDPHPSDCAPDAPGVITLVRCNVYFPDVIPSTWLHCIDVDPGFVEIDHDPDLSVIADYRLIPTSAMVDAGTPMGDEPDQILADLLDVDDDGSIGVNLDLDLEIRILPGIASGCPRVDIGAYELVAADNCLTGDINDDCQVDGADLGLLLSAWGACPSPCPADLNCDGVVDGADLGLLLAAWGTSPLAYPRYCCEDPESLLGGGESESGLSAAELAEILGFPSVAAMVDWLIEQPFGEMVVYLSLLG